MTAISLRIIAPNCEVIVAQKIETIDGVYANGKNPRRLHLRFSGGTRQLQAELITTDKKTVKKRDILDKLPMPDVKLTQDEHFTLQSWLASRYYRPIFADEFDRRLKTKPFEIHKKIANTIKQTDTSCSAFRHRWRSRSRTYRAR
jgi:hypothetical protein